MKNNRGITLIALAITIIVITIIASVGTYSGVQALRDSKESAQLSEVGMVQQAVLENYTKYKTTGNDMYLRGTAVSYEDVSSLLSEMGITPKTITYSISSKANTSPYYYYRLSEANLKDMGISQVEGDTFIVNYATGEVINEILKKTRTGKALYVYSTKADELKGEIKITFDPNESTYEYYGKIDIKINVESTFELCELKYVKTKKNLAELSKSDFTEDVPETQNCRLDYNMTPFSLGVYARDIYGNETIALSGQYYVYPPI